jgi:hypothetical protein
MSIATEFIDFIVPIENIRQKYPGGWEQCLKDHEHLLKGRVWFDDYLFRDGAMSPADIELIVERWEAMGFDGIVEEDGKKYWKDVCVCEGLFGGATLACDWLAFDLKTRSAYLKGTELGELVYPDRGDEDKS